MKYILFIIGLITASGVAAQRNPGNTSVLTRAEVIAARAAPGDNTDITSIQLNQTGLRVKGGNNNYLTIQPNETFTQNRVLSLVLNDADKTINLAGNLTTSGGHSVTLTTTGATNVTLPTSGTLTSTASPAFTGTPTAPTAAFGTNTTQLATTAFVQADGPTYARVTGSNATTTGQALADITGLSIALDANSVYEFEAVLSVQSSSTAGNQYGVNYSAAGATVEAQISGTLAAATSRSDRINTLNSAAPAYVTSGATGGIRIQGIITTGANTGNLVIRHLKVTSGTSTVFINSYLKTQKIQ